jgi:3-hydroxyanthranilate 3,4-dioxygenase
MAIASAFNFKKWIDDNRDKLKPPVGNIQVYKEAETFIIMVVGGPNKRKDYHYNESEEFFYQLQGNIVVKIIENGKAREVPIKEGEIFLLPPKVPHSPQREANSIGLVVEKVRQPGETDGLQWYCENCGEKLYDEYFELKDIVKQLSAAMERFYKNEDLRTCNNCGTVMESPMKN